MLFTPMKFLRESIKAVPALKYALGIVGIISAIVIVKSMGINFKVAVFGTIVMFIFMVTLVLFVNLTKIKKKHFVYPSLIMLWVFSLISVITGLLLFTSLFFLWPINLTIWFPNNDAINSYLKIQDAVPYSIEYNFSTATIVDLLLTNKGNKDVELSRIKVNILKYKSFYFDPCPCCARDIVKDVYNISLSKVLLGIDEYKFPQIIKAGETERISIVFGGNFRDSSFFAILKLSLILNDSSFISTNPLKVFVMNFEDSKQTEIGSKNNQKWVNAVKREINKGTSPILNRSRVINIFKHRFTYIKKHCKRIVKMPQIPKWI